MSFTEKKKTQKAKLSISTSPFLGYLLIYALSWKNDSQTSYRWASIFFSDYVIYTIVSFILTPLLLNVQILNADHLAQVKSKAHARDSSCTVFFQIWTSITKNHEMSALSKKPFYCLNSLNKVCPNESIINHNQYETMC